jgi:hypothetical protein
MRRILMMTASVALIGLAACDKAPATGEPSPESSAAAPAAAPAVAAASSVDAELEQLKAVTPLDACATLTPEKLKVVYPDLTFEVHQNVAPQMSGYTWDSRCSYRAGVGSIEFAKDVPTHTVDIAIATVVSEAKAQANLGSRHEQAKTTTGYQAQPSVGTDAYAVTGTGMARLHFVKGQSEIQINVSDLKSPNEEKIKNAAALAQSL